MFVEPYDGALFNPSLDDLKFGSRVKVRDGKGDNDLPEGMRHYTVIAVVYYADVRGYDDAVKTQHGILLIGDDLVTSKIWDVSRFERIYM